MNARVVRVDEVAPQPWRNGGGATRELLAWPDAAGWRVRVSVADIDRDGPFSSFPGVRRWFAVLDGAGVVLDVDGVSTRIGVGDAPFAFAGEARVGCRLPDGPTRDLNFMLRDASGAMSSVDPSRAWQPAAARCGLFAASAGRCVADGVSKAVPARALCWFDPAPRELRFEPAIVDADPAGWWLAAGDEVPAAP